MPDRFQLESDIAGAYNVKEDIVALINMLMREEVDRESLVKILTSIANVHLLRMDELESTFEKMLEEGLIQ